MIMENGSIVNGPLWIADMLNISFVNFANYIGEPDDDNNILFSEKSGDGILEKLKKLNINKSMSYD